MVNSLNKCMAIVTFAMNIMNWTLSCITGGSHPFGVCLEDSFVMITQKIV